MTLLFVVIIAMVIGFLIAFQRSINGLIMRLKKRSGVYRINGRRYFLRTLTPAQLGVILERFGTAPLLQGKDMTDALFDMGTLVRAMRTNLDNVITILAIVLVPVLNPNTPKTDAEIDALAKHLAMRDVDEILRMYDAFFFVNGQACSILRAWLRQLAKETGKGLGMLTKQALKEFSDYTTSVQSAPESQATTPSGTATS